MDQHKSCPISDTLSTIRSICRHLKSKSHTQVKQTNNQQSFPFDTSLTVDQQSGRSVFLNPRLVFLRELHRFWFKFVLFTATKTLIAVCRKLCRLHPSSTKRFPVSSVRQSVRGLGLRLRQQIPWRPLVALCVCYNKFSWKSGAHFRVKFVTKITHKIMHEFKIFTFPC